MRHAPVADLPPDNPNDGDSGDGLTPRQLLAVEICARVLADAYDDRFAGRSVSTNC
ncbi:hypothetical protein P3H15_32110 [Rhodococcus sp. T2V]|uniref:hypothetical protein n=1 Tax=Rhodococcus sp. T2V TaxID=3034164 RepID=UPI0023E0FB64|nr:hypothetical protein [Rhodococcus sp. T2V]MDF3309664.1 hypothetical protein [Rhodococcus sp. T2V]